MTQFSEDQLQVIKTYPIKDELDSFRASFESACAPINDRSDNVEEFLVSFNGRDIVLNLLGALQLLPASSRLCFGHDVGRLSGNIALLYAGLSSGQIDLRHTADLVRAVVARAEDTQIWTAVYDLITRTKPSPVTPPHSGAPFAVSKQTPWKFSTASAVNSSDLRRDVGPMLRAEMENNITIDQPLLFDAFFGQVSRLTEITAAVFKKCKATEPPLYTDDSGWTEWPGSCEESKVLGWLRCLISQMLTFANESGFRPSKRRRYIATPNKPLLGSVSKRKLDVGLAYDPGNQVEGYDNQDCAWTDILIAGELKSNPQEDTHNSTWFDLLRYVREVFGAQVTRRFVLGFTLCGSIIRLWELDRLGALASRPFDINRDGQKFASMILGFLWMNEEELGFDPTIVEGGKQVEIQRDGQYERLYLQDVIRRQRSVVGRATTCWIGRLIGTKPMQRVVVKDSWEYEERPEEGDLLMNATKSGAENVALWYHHETVYVGGTVDDVYHNVRKGLSTADAASNSSGPGNGRSASGSSMRKRSRSSLQISMPPPKRSCSGSQRLRNRVHRRVIMHGVGKSIDQASTLKTMLTALLGGIKGHESLLNINILHRDISIGNIMLNEAEDDGFLIDLDLAIKANREEVSGAPSKTGTKVFMAIGVLHGDEGHNFMHDLESFFWVLFWIGVHWNGPGQSRGNSKYEAWNYEPTTQLAQIKKGTVVEEDSFSKEVGESFTEYCKPLVPCILELRKVVFPGGKRWLSEHRGLYPRMKAVLEEAREAL
ncbi:hypothetical protein BDY21DRAFT_329029 [Lineolata rhizophorae]|uniref:EKC/KEOPS complex subunit BUD32 n=1 Tax=Lineolata rhizophorae TaxID=578093 RepID=A0A6A6NMJ2_9PEZI|nr:hypothetical protein BDY21DRAFT_329029 [Lineolata rhizophorae]